MSLHQALRTKHPRFIYRSASWQVVEDTLQLTWQFELTPDIVFKPQMAIPLPTGFKQNETNGVIIDELVFQIGLVEMLSYWKAAASPLIEIKAGSLTLDQISWWKKLLLKGMGEYFYTNQIDFSGDDFVTVNATNSKETTLIPREKSNSSKDSYLIPLGGGKDSIVSLELMRQYQKEKQDSIQLTTMAINPTPATRQIAQTANLPLLEVRRKLDPQLIELNSQGYLNGHTPFSALVAFTSLLTGYLHSSTNIVLSNEHSSNEGNTTYLGQEINHQYSKTFEFEQDFTQYVTKYLSNNLPKYYSLLRPLYELKIGQLFARLAPEYFSIFRSCNRGQKQGIWCNQCSKCLFAFIILFPFLGEEQTVKIFGQNLFEDASLYDLALELIGQTKIKPLECVGTKQESLVAFFLSSNWYQDNSQPLPVVLEKLQPLLDNQPNLPAQAETILTGWNENHLVPPQLLEFIKTK
jgi:UDP-N-acetyl-alpha-D-muramoyl-L-alanyl-L-glutamate epimerase